MLVDINLLPQKERDRPASIVAAISILLLAILIWAIFAFLASANEKEQAALTMQSTQVAAEQAAIRQQLEATQGLNEEQQLKVTVDWAEKYQFDTLPLLEELTSKLPARGFFDSFTYTGMDVAVLGVQFDTAREAAYYLAQLKASEMLESATLDSVTQEAVETTATTDGETVVAEGPKENPRYLATYTLIFVDGRVPAAVVEGAPAADPNAPAEATPATPTAPTAPAEKAPAAPAAEEPDTEVDVEVNTETPPNANTETTPETNTETAPTETEGDGQ